MLKKTITYTDLDGNQVVEDFYFNISKAEIAEMELSEEGGLSNKLKAILDSKDPAQIMSTFRMMIAKAVGRRHEDGRQFIKNDDVTNAFMQTDAYSVLFMELVTNANAAADFIIGVLPSDAAEKVNVREIMAAEPDFTSKNVSIYQEAKKKVLIDYTDAELEAMPYDELERLYRSFKGVVGKHVLAIIMRKLNEN